MPVDRNLLIQLPAFKGLSDEALELLTTTAQVKRFPAAQLVMAHHTIPAYLVMVIRGHLQKTEISEDGRITGISLVNPGQVLDWLSAIDGAPIIWSVNTTQESDLLLVPMTVIRQLLNEQLSLCAIVQEALAQDVRRITEQRQLLTLPNAFQRVFVQIVQLAEQSPDQKSANLPKQHEIAAMVNTSRETVSRAIQMLVKNGILVKHGHRFVVQGADQLKRLALTGVNDPGTGKTEKT